MCFIEMMLGCKIHPQQQCGTSPFLFGLEQKKTVGVAFY